MFATAAVNGSVAILSARGLGTSGRGQLTILIATVSLTTLLTCVSVNTAGRYHLMSETDRVELPDYLGLSAALMALEGVTCWATTWATFRVLDIEVDVWILVVTSVFGSSFLGALHFRDALNAFGYTAKASAFSCLGSATTALLAGGLMLLDVTTLIGFSISFAVGSIAECAGHLWYLNRKGHRPQFRLRKDSAFKLMRRGAPALGLTAGQSLAFRLDRYILGFFSGSSVVGIYSIAATASELLRLVPAAFGQIALFRTASGTISPKDLAKARAALLAGMVLPIVLMAWFAPQIIELAFGPAYSAAVLPMRILLIGELAIMSFQIDTRVLTGHGAISRAGLAGLIGLLAVASLDFAFIPSHGIEGAAWASVFSYVAMGAAAWIFVVCHNRPHRQLRSQVVHPRNEIRRHS